MVPRKPLFATDLDVIDAMEARKLRLIVWNNKNWTEDVWMQFIMQGDFI